MDTTTTTTAATTQVAQRLVDFCRAGDFMKAVDTLYAQDIVSVEPHAMGSMPAETSGLAAVRGKGEWWVANHEVHGTTVGGPFVAGDRFVVTFDMDVTQKASGKRFQMSEAGVYTVAGGKVVREEFLYAPQPGM